MANAEELLQAFDDVISDGVRRGMLHSAASDDRLDGRTVTVDGQRLVNFGSCSYLGLETHPAMRAAVVDATERYGTQFSSSRTYLSAPAYAAAEQALTELFERPALIAPSTTMGHLAALPTLVGVRDALVLDHQVHHSVQTAAKLAQAQGSTVMLVPHSDLGALADTIAALRGNHRRIWYAADGLYSMYADFAPIAELNELVAAHDQLWLYVDDAHSVSWTGRRGRGHALDLLSEEARRRSVVAASLNKSFAAAGGVLTFDDEETRRRVFTVGGPLIFSGPVQPPMLGAILATARLHLSGRVEDRRARLRERIALFNRLSAEAGLPLLSTTEAPIRCVGAGVPAIAYDLTRRLRAAGYFVDTATYPAVAAKRSGARVTLTAHHTADDVAGLVDALADALPRSLAAEGGSVDGLRQVFARQLGGRPVRLRPAGGARPARPAALRLERYGSVGELDTAEWDRLFGGRGAFDSGALAALERAFAPGYDDPEHEWVFDYLLVRPAGGGAPVAATFLTTALWKDDMLSAGEVSAEVERSRAADPYHLTSTVVATGSLITEGNHLYLDRSVDWRSALGLVLAEARDIEDRADAAAVAVRDIPDGDAELHRALLAEGFLRVPLYDSWIREIDFTDTAGFLAGLSKRSRRHQRHHVFPWEDRYAVQVVTGGSGDAAAIGEADRDHLYQLYRDVHARNLGINVFPLPRRLLDEVLASPAFEVLILRLSETGDRPVSFVVQHVGGMTAGTPGGVAVAPMFLGLDYRYVASHHAYQQTLWQTVRSAQRHGAGRLLLGMGADLQKERFGARPHPHWVYVQPTDSYHADVLSRLTEQVASSA